MLPSAASTLNGRFRASRHWSALQSMHRVGGLSQWPTGKPSDLLPSSTDSPNGRTADVMRHAGARDVQSACSATPFCQRRVMYAGTLVYALNWIHLQPVQWPAVVRYSRPAHELLTMEPAPPIRGPACGETKRLGQLAGALMLSNEKPRWAVANLCNLASSGPTRGRGDAGQCSKRIGKREKKKTACKRRHGTDSYVRGTQAE